MTRKKKNIGLKVLYEDNHLVIVNKRPGDLVQGDKTGDRSLLDEVKAYIKKKYNKPGDVYLGLVHRLDRPVSGAVVFARTSKALTRMNELFRKDEVKKIYWAIVRNRPEMEEGLLVDHLRKNEKQNKSFVTKAGSKGSKEAKLSYTLKGSTDHFWKLEVQLMTGRHHQIRAQFSNLGSPIKGDLKYGADRSNKDGSIHLHAHSISFVHPVTKEPLSVIAPAPDEVLWNALDF